MNPQMPESVDVVVVGGGMSGLCASIAALEEGATVITLEKGTRFGGSMLLSQGFIWTFLDMHLLKRSVPEGDESLQGLIIEEADAARTWLSGQGVELGPEEGFMGFGRGRSAQPPQLTDALVNRVRRLGGHLCLDAPMLALCSDEGRVRGVRIGTSGGQTTVRSDAVVLATGGFQGNAELLTRYVTRHADKLYLRANPWSTGDGLLAAQALGAATTPYMNTFYGHALVAPPARISPFQFLEASQRYGPSAVALNLDGRRFTDESAGTGEEWLNQEIAQQDQATAAYVIDSAIAEIPPQSLEFPLTRVVVDRARDLGGPVVVADSLEELCLRMADWGIPHERSLRTLLAYNAAISTGKGLCPSRESNRLALTHPAFTAVLVRAGITFTCGGLLVDNDMRVLRQARSSSALPLAAALSDEFVWGYVNGLYAAGCDVGGVSNYGYVGGLVTALVTGRRAGTTAVTDR